MFLAYFIHTQRRLARALRVLPQSLRLVWRASARWTAAWALLVIAQGSLPVALVYLTKQLVDAVVTATRGALDPYALLGRAGLMLGLLLLGEALRGMAGAVQRVQAELLFDHVTGLIHAQSARVDYAFYELPDFYDHLHRARAEASYRAVSLVESLGRLAQDAVTLLGMAAVVTAFAWWLPLALLLSTLPALVVVVWQTLRQHEWRVRHTADERRAWYFDELLTTGAAAAELRLFDLGEHFQTRYRAVRARLRAGQLRLAWQESAAEFAASVAGLIVTGAALLWVFRRVLAGAATLGTLALFYQAFNQGQALMRSLLGNVGQLYASSLFLGELFEFLALPARVGDPAAPVAALPALQRGITFENVSFTYPNATQPALCNFSLHIPAGRTVAIVGLNGAGKSTLLKLLCRFYDVDAGHVLLDNVEVSQMRVAELRRMITALWQTPVQYNATVAENIRFGDLNVEEDDGARLQAAARGAGAASVIERLPHGYDSLLGKRFAGGSELSVGEWQRVALARAYWRAAPIMLLDEPTSAMDSWAEAEWLGRLRALAAGRTVLMITHRFTTAMQADEIHVMAAGRIVESGTHATLLAQGGVYAESWRAQMQAQRQDGE